MKNFIEHINLNPKIKRIIILLLVIVIIIYFSDYFIYLITLSFIWLYILLNIDKLRKVALFLIILPVISSVLFMFFPVFTPVFTIFPFMIFMRFSPYTFPLLGLISIVFIKNGKQIFPNTLFLIVLILFLNHIFVFHYNRSYYDLYPYKDVEMYLSDEDYDIICKGELFNESLLAYKYHTPKSNLFLPTLGIRYKEIYEEDRGFVMIYEKRSFLNLYVGDGRVLCNSYETLE